MRRRFIALAKILNEDALVGMRYYFRDFGNVPYRGNSQIASYPPKYLNSPTTDTRILETVERLEEDLTDRAGIHGPLEVIIEVDEAIEVPTERSPRGEEDPIMKRLRERLTCMLDRLAKEANTVH